MSTTLTLGGYGTELITGSVTDKDFAYIAVNAAAVFTTLTDSEGRDMTAAASNAGGLNIGSTEIAAGMVIRAVGGSRIKAVNVSQGSVFGIYAEG